MLVISIHRLLGLLQCYDDKDKCILKMKPYLIIVAVVSVSQPPVTLVASFCLFDTLTYRVLSSESYYRL